MRRGEVWTVRAAGYASKARPAVIVQADTADAFDSTIVCLFTTSDTVSGPTRVPVRATAANGLQRDSWIMAEKPVAVKKSHLGNRMGRIEESVMGMLDDALRTALGL